MGRTEILSTPTYVEGKSVVKALFFGMMKSVVEGGASRSVTECRSS